MPANSTSPETATTDRLIDACLRGDQQAWNAIVQRYRRKVFNVAYTFVGRHEEAEDLTQEIFLKVFKALNAFDRRANFQTWLVSVGRNLCIDHYRRVRKERETIDRRVDAAEVGPAAAGSDPLARLQRADQRDLLRRAMLRAPAVLREAVLLRDMQELTYDEIARRLALPVGTVKSRISRGRRELARQLVKLETESPPAHDPGGRLVNATSVNGARE